MYRDRKLDTCFYLVATEIKSRNKSGREAMAQDCSEPETLKNNDPEAEDLGQTKQSVLTNVHAALICPLGSEKSHLMNAL